MSQSRVISKNLSRVHPVTAVPMLCKSAPEWVDYPPSTSVQRDQGPIIQVWPSGQITLTGDVIGSMGSTMGYEATMVFRDLAIKLLGSYRHKADDNLPFIDFMPEF